MTTRVEDGVVQVLRTALKKIEEHGPSNVELGPGLRSDHGVYVRDLDDLLNELKEDILNFEMGHPIEEDT